nr:hypothetical protein [Paraburkholderia unamae]
MFQFIFISVSFQSDKWRRQAPVRQIDGLRAPAQDRCAKITAQSQAPGLVRRNKRAGGIVPRAHASLRARPAAGAGR